jgi:hypothetical protein
MSSTDVPITVKCKTCARRGRLDTAATREALHGTVVTRHVVRVVNVKVIDGTSHCKRVCKTVQDDKIRLIRCNINNWKESVRNENALPSASRRLQGSTSY